MAFDVTGKLLVIYETLQVSARFSKREFVIEIEDGRYPQAVLFQATGDRCDVLDDFRIGDQVRVTFNLRGREWRSPKGETRYFNSLDVWKLEPARGSQDISRRDSGGGSGGGGRRDPDRDARDLGDPFAPPPNDDDLPFITSAFLL